MAAPLRVPEIGGERQPGSLVQWYKDDGSEVAEGDAVFCFETGHVALEVEAPEHGRIHRCCPPGARAMPGNIVALILEPGERVPEHTEDPMGGVEDFVAPPPPPTPLARVESGPPVDHATDDDRDGREPIVLPLRRGALKAPPSAPSGGAWDRAFGSSGHDYRGFWPLRDEVPGEEVAEPEPHQRRVLQFTPHASPGAYEEETHESATDPVEAEFAQLAAVEPEPRRVSSFHDLIAPDGWSTEDEEDEYADAETYNPVAAYVDEDVETPAWMRWASGDAEPAESAVESPAPVAPVEAVEEPETLSGSFEVAPAVAEESSEAPAAYVETAAPFEFAKAVEEDLEPVLAEAAGVAMAAETAWEPGPASEAWQEQAPVYVLMAPVVMSGTVRLTEVRKLCDQLGREWRGEPGAPRNEDLVLRAAARAAAENPAFDGMPDRAGLVIPGPGADALTTLETAGRGSLRVRVAEMLAAEPGDDILSCGFTVVSFAGYGVEAAVPVLPEGHAFAFAMGATRPGTAMDDGIPAPMMTLTLAYAAERLSQGDAAALFARTRELIEAPYALLAD